MSLQIPQSLRSLLEQQSHRIATLWRIKRKDGVQLFFTDHDTVLIFNGDTYSPAGGFDSTAKQKQGGLKTQNLELRGILSSDDITFEDLRAGRYREAEITEFLIEWMHPFAGALLTTKYWIVETEFSNELWNARVEGIGRWLGTRVGDVHGRTCRYTLGDSQCQVKLGDFTSLLATVATVIDKRRIFESDLTDVDGFFNFGELEWIVAGKLDNLRFDVKTYLNASGKVELQLETPFDITTGDTFIVSAGCDKTLATCRDKFNNLLFHGGFPTIPGTDKMMDTPDSN